MYFPICTGRNEQLQPWTRHVRWNNCIRKWS